MSEKIKIMFKSVSEMPPLAVSLDNMDWNKTGSWRYMRPVYQYKTAPCIPACPAGEKIPRYLRELVKGDPAKAWTTLIKDNPFPSVCGRICRYPCEAACNRRRFDSPIAIRSLERYLGDYGRAHGKFEPVILEKGKRVAVIGSGPAGLTCAFHLRLEGYAVDVFEAMNSPGGAIRYRIPSFRLPEDVLDEEIDLVVRTGVNVRTGVRVGEHKDFDELLSYDAVFVSTGAWMEKPLGMEGENLAGVHSAGKFLRSVKEGERAELGEIVAVIGSDESAVDAARTLLRMGKKPVILSEKSKGDMVVAPFELEDALKEGVVLEQMVKVNRIIGRNGKADKVEFVKLTLGPPDAFGRRASAPVEGGGRQLDVGGVITCPDSLPVMDFLPESIRGDGNGLHPDEYGRTTHEKVFAGGDAVAGMKGTVVDAIGSGKNAALAIDLFLQNKSPREAGSKRDIVRYDTLNVLYFRKEERPLRQTILPVDAAKSFDECELGMDAQSAAREADRCMSCGVCTECDNCLIFCPDVAISKLRKGYKINYDYCKGCGICVHECPRNCMSLVEELKWKK